jgi:hypothetical protein
MAQQQQQQHEKKKEKEKEKELPNFSVSCQFVPTLSHVETLIDSCLQLLPHASELLWDCEIKLGLSDNDKLINVEGLDYHALKIALKQTFALGLFLEWKPDPRITPAVSFWFRLAGSSAQFRAAAAYQE